MGLPSLKVEEPKRGCLVFGWRKGNRPAKGQAAAGLGVTQQTKPPTLAWYF